MHNTGSVPQQHVGTGLALDITPKVLVWPPDDLFPVIHQGFDNLQCTTGRYNPVGTGLYGSGSVGIHHNGTLGMLVTKSGKLLYRTTQIQRAGRFQSWHQNALLRAEDFGGFAHETYASNHQGLCFMVTTKAEIGRASCRER